MKKLVLRCLALPAACLLLAAPAFAQNNNDPTPRDNAPRGVTVRGKVVRVQAPDQFVIRTDANKEVVLYGNPQTRYLLNNKAARFADLRVGSELSAVYVEQGDRFIANTVTVDTAVQNPPPAAEPVPPPVEKAPPPAEATEVRGTVVRVVGQDQVVVKTSDNKEVIVYVQPQTKYVVADQPAQFTDIRPNNEIRVQYDVRDRRNIARGIFLPRRNK